MKTRSNMPLFVVETNNVKALSNSQIDLLRCGDYLVKKDETGEHAYKVTFKSDTGMCITYHDAYCIETQSYDKVGQNWVYNSEDKTIIAEPQMENIVDKDGHNRFIEGDIVLDSGVPEGYSKIYGKWSLCGSHLLIVICYEIPASTTTGYVPTLCEIDLPTWVKNKIVAVGNTWVEYKVFNGVTAQDSILQVQIQLRKRDGTRITISQSTVTTTDALRVRAAFDLLIDNE